MYVVTFYKGKINDHSIPVPIEQALTLITSLERHGFDCILYASL